MLIEVVIPDLEALNANAMCVFASEMADRHRDLMQDRAGDIQPEVLTRLLQGRSVSATAYHEAMSALEPSTRAFCGEVFAAIDALMLPASPTIAPLAIDVLAGGAMPLPSQAVDPGRYTRAFNYLGLPAMALPAGFDPAGLPIGMQLVGRPFDDALLLNIGHQYQEVTDWHRRRPTAPLGPFSQPECPDA